jgi:alkyl sulfatase BDS1-like metallo-beta-lactamase superfamily hydrolase
MEISAKEHAMDSKEAHQQAFDAIHDEALWLLNREHTSYDIRQGLRLIISLTWYKRDIRSESDLAKHSKQAH